MSAKFESLVYPEPNTGCWLWAGRHDSNGYGRGHFANRTIQLAHRYAYLLYKEDPQKKHVLHKCDNPACVNPEHLYLGDQKQNNIDRDSRGRQKTARGCNHKLSKLSEGEVLCIRSLHDTGKFPSRLLAKMYSCSQKAIMNIINYKSYKNVLHNNA